MSSPRVRNSGTHVPDDAIANLNAANATMRRGDPTGAERYLDRAGDSPEGRLCLRRTGRPGEKITTVPDAT